MNTGVEGYVIKLVHSKQYLEVGENIYTECPVYDVPELRNFIT